MLFRVTGICWTTEGMQEEEVLTFAWEKQGSFRS